MDRNEEKQFYNNGVFNVPLSIMDRITIQKFSKEKEELNNTVNQLDITDKYRTFHPKTSK